MNWHIIFYRNDSGHCPFEKFIDRLPEEDAHEVVASIAALRELGNKARRPLVDYLENGIYELRGPDGSKNNFEFYTRLWVKAKFSS